MRERGLSVDHVIIFRLVRRYAPEINERMRPHLKMSRTSYRIDETYVEVGTEWKYLYRAVDSAGDTVEFMLSARRDVSAAKRFFKKPMRVDQRRLPFTIGTDMHASYPEAFAAPIEEKVLPRDCKLRRVKYLNNVIEQDHGGLQTLPKTSEYVFPSPKTSSRVMDAWRQFERAVKATNLSGFRFHDLRHTAASRMAGAGVDPFTLAYIFGWSDIPWRCAARTRRTPR